MNEPETTKNNFQIPNKDPKNQSLILNLFSPLLMIGMSFLQDPINMFGILNLAFVIYLLFVFLAFVIYSLFIFFIEADLNRIGMAPSPSTVARLMISRASFLSAARE